MEQVRNEQTIYSAAVYCRLSKDDEQAGESISIETQKMMLMDFYKGFCMVKYTCICFRFIGLVCRSCKVKTYKG